MRRLSLGKISPKPSARRRIVGHFFVLPLANSSFVLTITLVRATAWAFYYLVLVAVLEIDSPVYRPYPAMYCVYLWENVLQEVKLLYVLRTQGGSRTFFVENMMEKVTILDEKPVCHESAIGCDVHSDNIVCCSLQKGADGKWTETREVFSTNYSVLPGFAQWCGLFNPGAIIMESTADYWRSPYEALEAVGLPVFVVNPAHVKGLAGHKSDQEDASWLAQIATNGAYKPSFIPTMTYRHLAVVERNLLKQIGSLKDYKNRETRFFVVAGYRLGVFSDQFGKMATIAKNAILAGKTPEEVLQAVRTEPASKKLKATDEALLEAFHGNMTENLKRAIESNRRIMDDITEEIKHNKEFLIEEIQKTDGIVFKFLQTIPGINAFSAAIILIETGGEVKFRSSFRRAENFASWLGLCPGNNDSNSKRTGRKQRHGNKYLRQCLCESAQSTPRAKGSTFQSKFKSLLVRLGYKRTIVAIAHKIAKMVFYVLKNHKIYKDPKINYQELSCKKNKSRWLKQLLACEDLEIQATNKTTGEVYNSSTFRSIKKVIQKAELKEKISE